MVNTGGSGVVVAAVLSQLGKPYVWDTPVNAATPDPPTFDCSGLAMWAYHKAGVTIPHQTNAIYAQLQHRPLSEAEPGDLVFFGNLADLYHVGVYIGDSTIVEAPDVGIPVRRRQVSSSSNGIWHNVGVFPGSQTASGSNVTVTYAQFFTDVLTRMGLPATTANLRALASVSIAEGPNDRYNPLNSVVKSGDSTTYNSVGVQDYGSYSNGVAGTVSLLQGSPWAGVVSALRSGNSTGGVLNAFSQEYSSWGSHPNFNFGTSRTDQLLSSPIGTSSTGVGGSGSSAPFSPSSLTPPLSAATRSTIIAWIVSNSHGSNPTQLAAMSDANLIAVYTGVVGINGATSNGTNTLDSLGLSGLTTLLSWITSVKNWERMGLFALGAIILIFTAMEIFGVGKVPLT